MARILADTTDLHGALCVGQSELFDEDSSREQFEAATGLCRRCPVRGVCWQWSTATRVAGVTASSETPPRSRTDTSEASDLTGGRRPSNTTVAVRSRRYRAHKREA